MKKGQTHFKFIRPMSNMRLVLSVVEQGNCTRQAIADASGLTKGEVINALRNLTYNKITQKVKDRNRKSIYILHGHAIPWEFASVSETVKGINSIFSVTTKIDNH